MNEGSRLPADTGFFSWGDGTWGEVHRFVRYDDRGDFYANALCGARFKVNHVSARTAEDWADVPCGECEVAQG